MTTISPCRAAVRWKRPAADLEDYRVAILRGLFCGSIRFRSSFGFYGFSIDQGAGLHLGDDLFCLRGPLGADLLFVPIGRFRLAVFELGFFEQRSFGVCLGIDQGKRNFGHAERFALPGSGEDHVFHLGSAEALG